MTPELQRNAGFEKFTPEDFFERFNLKEVSKPADLNALQRVAQAVGLPTGVKAEPVDEQGFTGTQRSNLEAGTEKLRQEYGDKFKADAPLHAALANPATLKIRWNIRSPKAIFHGDMTDDELQGTLQDEYSRNPRKASRGGSFFDRNAGGIPATMARFDKSNLSTGIHELGHYVLETIESLAVMPDASEQMKANVAALRSGRASRLAASGKKNTTKSWPRTWKNTSWKASRRPRDSSRFCNAWPGGWPRPTSKCET